MNSLYERTLEMWDLFTLLGLMLISENGTLRSPRISKSERKRNKEYLKKRNRKKEKEN